MAFGILLTWIALSVISGVIANNKGRSGIGFFFLALILSPLIGIIAALVVKENIDNVEKRKLDTGSNIKCPFCAELIKAEAKICKYCGKQLSSKETVKSLVDIEIEKSVVISKKEIKQRMKPFNLKPEDISIGDEVKKCPVCAEKIKIEALKCRFCGEQFNPAKVKKQISDIKLKIFKTKENEYFLKQSPKIRDEILKEKVKEKSYIDPVLARKRNKECVYCGFKLPVISDSEYCSTIHENLYKNDGAINL